MKVRIWALLLLFSYTFFIECNILPDTDLLHEKIQSLYLKTITPKEQDSFQSNIHPYSTHEYYTTIFNNFYHRELTNPIVSTADFVNENNICTPNGIVNYLKPYIRTDMGTVCFLNYITQPSANIDTIKKQQQKIKLLSENSSLVERCIKKLSTIAHHEPYFTQIISAQMTNFNKFVQKQFFNSLIPKDTSFFIQQTKFTFQNFVSIFILGLCPLSFCLLLHNKVYEKNPELWHKITFAILGNKITTISDGENKIPSQTEINLGIITMIGAIIYSSYKTISEQKSKSEFLRTMQTELKHVASVMKAAEKIYREIKPYNIITPHFPSAELSHLLSLLKSPTFKGTPSIFSFHGRITSTWQNVLELKDEIIAYLQPLAQLDVYIGMAQLINNHTNTKNHWTFVDPITSSHPVIEATQLWHPLVGAEKAVPNSINLGNAQPNHMIITGPNTAGKSTIMEALCTALLFAQSFGIAPAEKFTFTPFSALLCHLNIKDDIATSASLFKAEVNNIETVKKTVANLPSHEFAFIMIDEMFRSTDPMTAEVALQKVLKTIYSYKNATSVMATHYHAAAQNLENTLPNSVQNAHIQIIQHDTGFDRTFTLQSGVSPIISNVVSEQILSEHFDH